MAPREEGTDLIESVEDIEKILDFDPFAPGATEGAGDVGGEPGEATAAPTPQAPAAAAGPEGGPEEGADPTAADPLVAPPEPAGPPEGGDPVSPTADPPAEPAAPAAAPDPRDAEITLLREQNKQIAQMMQTMQAQSHASVKAMQQTAAAAAPQKAPEAEEDGTPLYEYDIPDTIVEALESEDKNHRKAALASIVKGTAQAVHRQIMSTMGNRFEEHTAGISAAQQQQGQDKQVYDDFYAAYPALENPGIRPIVQQAAQLVINETQAQGWTPQLRDLIGQRAVAMLTQAAQGVVPALGNYTPPPPGVQVVPPAGAPVVPPVTTAPPTQVGVHARPGVAKVGDVSAEVEAMMGFV